MQQLHATSILLIFSLFLSGNVLASAFTPTDDTVIATSNSTLVAQLTVAEIDELVHSSQYIGQTERLQGILKTQLARLYQQKPTPQTGYLYARVLQKEHQFDAAINIATDVLSGAPNHSNSHLLLANIYMIQGKQLLAKQHCTALLGQVSVITVSTCVLDVQSQQGKLLQSYQALQKITNNKDISLATAHVLSEMSYRLNNFKTALAYIEDVDLQRAPVSLIVLWADAQLALNNAPEVLSTLSDLLTDSSNLEDAILLRLAIAEQQLAKSTQWQTRMQRRVALRELRQDTFHASDLAHYYITIQPNPDKALYWANINWQHAKMSADEQLLTQAKAMQRATL
jgi:tetratricopeptide (TPR) repeat protein